MGQRYKAVMQLGCSSYSIVEAAKFATCPQNRCQLKNLPGFDGPCFNGTPYLAIDMYVFFGSSVNIRQWTHVWSFNDACMNSLSVQGTICAYVIMIKKFILSEEVLLHHSVDIYMIQKH